MSKVVVKVLYSVSKMVVSTVFSMAVYLAVKMAYATVGKMVCH